MVKGLSERAGLHQVIDMGPLEDASVCKSSKTVNPEEHRTN